MIWEYYENLSRTVEILKEFLLIRWDYDMNFYPWFWIIAGTFSQTIKYLQDIFV